MFAGKHSNYFKRNNKKMFYVKHFLWNRRK